MTWILSALAGLLILLVLFKIGTKILAVVGGLFLISTLAGVAFFLVTAMKRGSFGGVGLPELIHIVGLLLPVCLLLLVLLRRVFKLPKLLTVPLALCLLGGYAVLGMILGGLQMSTLLLCAIATLLVLVA